MVFWWVFWTVLVIGFLWWFVHRDPNRYCPPIRGYVSPADGVVHKIIDLSGDTKIKKNDHGFTFFKKDFPDARYAVVIMLKIWHVHTQRAPIAGTVRDVKHRDGTYKNAVFGSTDAATVENEHLGLTISGERSCRVYLVAGLVARRIVQLISNKERVSQGQRISRIKLGSQCVLVLPECDILVSPGERVYAGLSGVAR